MEKSRAIELLEHLAWDRDIDRNPYGDALNMAIDALKAQLSSEGATSDQHVAADTNVGDTISRQAAIDAVIEWYGCEPSDLDYFKRIVAKLPSAQPEQQHGRVFKGIVVAEYPEYKGKPYFSIKYTENGQEFIGYSTYKLEVLSEYLKEYFMSSAQPERKKGRWVKHGTGHSIYYDCSLCGCVAPCTEVGDSFIWKSSTYCPDCGAKMGNDEKLLRTVEVKK